VAAVALTTAMLALGATAAVASVVGVAIAIGWRRGRNSPWLAAWLVRRHRHKQLRATRQQRSHALQRAGVHEHQLVDLTQFVDEIAERDADAVERYDLEALLDRYVDKEIARTRTRAMLQRFDRTVLARQLGAIPVGIKQTRRDLLRRRLEHLDVCRHRAAALDDDIEEIRELLCLLAQRTSVGDVGELDEVIEAMETNEVERRMLMIEGFDMLRDDAA